MTITYVLACTPRSGSYALCDLLQQTGIAGIPTEYEARADWTGAFHRRYFDGFRAAGSTPNGVFGWKAMWFQLLELGNDLAYYGLTRRSEPHARLVDGFGPHRYLRLRRRSRVAQALSWLKARATLQWSLRPGEPAAPWPAVPTRAAIDEAIAVIDRQEAGWSSYFASLGVAPLVFDYEDLAADPAALVTRVLAALDLDVPRPAPPLRPRLRRQADAQTAELVRRYDAGTL